MRPATIQELYNFYYDICKPIHAHIQTLNRPPQETWWEVSAAFDHLSRQYMYGESEAMVVDKAAAHLKRSCLDAFKLFLKLTRDNYKELLTVDLGSIQRGQFKQGLISLWTEIEDHAKKARVGEGKTRSDEDYHKLFDDHWFPVYEKCCELNLKYYASPDVAWAKKRAITKRLVGWIVGGLIGAVIGFLLNGFMGWLK